MGNIDSEDDADNVHNDCFADDVDNTDSADRALTINYVDDANDADHANHANHANHLIDENHQNSYLPRG